MNLPHRWDLTPTEAIALQKELAAQVIQTDTLAVADIKTVAGIDLWHSKDSNAGRAAVVVLSFPDLEVIEEVTAEAEVLFPYVPGLLSFRESPLALAALEKLSALPDVLFVDGQGYAHPRRFGIACHLGVLLDKPAVGIGKTLYVGKYEDLGEERGNTAPLIHKDEIIGAAVRTKNKTNPLFVSLGHKISRETAIELVLQTGRGYRLPETTRRAHLLAGGQSQR